MDTTRTTSDDARHPNDKLAHDANAGSRVAAGTYLRNNLSYLQHMGRGIAQGRIEADDLVADALSALLAVWAKGTGPTSSVNSYVIRSMRNAMIDERRSPRSRVESIADMDDALPPEQLSTRDIDLHREYGYVTAALLSLPPDQQTILRATLIDGRKPADLEGELQRPASALCALGLRARTALRRTTLRVVVEEDAPAGRVPADFPRRRYPAMSRGSRAVLKLARLPLPFGPHNAMLIPCHGRAGTGSAPGPPRHI